MIKEGTIAADIARTLNLKKSHISYYVTRADKLGYIEKTKKDVFVELKLTQAGKNFLDQYNKNHPSIPICRLENIQFKAVITQMPTIPVDWKKIEMHNWIQYSHQIDSVKVRLNMGKNPTLELLPSPVDGDNPYVLFITVVYECINTILELNDKIGLRVGKLEVASKPEWVMYDPVAKAFCKHNGQVTHNGIGKANASKPRGIGEFEFFDPRALMDYMLMPQRLKNMEYSTEKISKKLDLLEMHVSGLLRKVFEQYSESE
jgi:hypothetical protein